MWRALRFGGLVRRERRRRPRLGLLLALVMALAPVESVVHAQAPPPQAVALVGSSDCVRCHYCDAPTAPDPCLREPCTRNQRSSGPRDFGPDVLILDALTRDFLPVPFDHGGHARMAAMGQGCATCHHHSPDGVRPPACQTCHDPAVEGTDPQKPGLKGAYHQQCLNCHREWTDETACEACHLSRAGRRGRTAASGFPTTDENLKRTHPPMLPPTGELYGRSANTEGHVLFRHAHHVDRFGLACVECHHEPRCARCHDGSDGSRSKATLIEHHRPCVRCHKEDMNLAGRVAGNCERCHWREGTPKPKPFDHAATGWPLSSFHARIRCCDCHADAPYKRLDARCDSCHSAWTGTTFDHRVTGQALDEAHVAIDCNVCHRDRRFELPPVCDDCHSDEEDSISFPAHRPGAVVEREP